MSHCEGERSSDKGSGGKIGSCASRAKMAERPNEKDEAHTVTKETDSYHGKHRYSGQAISRPWRAQGRYLQRPR